jgi:hypothetical protein
MLRFIAWVQSFQLAIKEVIAIHGKILRKSQAVIILGCFCNLTIKEPLFQYITKPLSMIHAN